MIYANAIFVALVCFLVAAWVLIKLKQFLVDSSCTITREIEHGENAHFTISFYVFETAAMRNRKYQRAVGIGEFRKQFVWDRFQQTLETKQNQHLKAVESKEG
jgi:small-conductance mechanosensitive channel